MSVALAAALGICAGLGARALARTELVEVRARQLAGNGWPLAAVVAVLLWIALGPGASAEPSAEWPLAVLSATPLVSLAIGGAALATVDQRTHQLPDRLLLATAAPAVASSALLVLLNANPEPFLRGLSAAIAACAALLVLALLAPGQLGGGDLKLVLLLGFILGTRSLSAVLFGLGAGSLAAGVLGAAALLRPASRLSGGGAVRAAQVPLGPALLLGSWVGIVLTGE